MSRGRLLGAALAVACDGSAAPSGDAVTRRADSGTALPPDGAAASPDAAPPAFLPTTTWEAETGNNTSAADGFPGLRNGVPAAANASKRSLRDLLPDLPAEAPVLAHWMPWFGREGHLGVGYRSDDPEQAARQVGDMASRGIDGAIVDWYGPGFAFEDAATARLRDAAEDHGSFLFALTADAGSLRWCDCDDPTARLIDDLRYAHDRYWTSPAYLRRDGRPLVLLFGDEEFALDWARVRSAVPEDPLLIGRGARAFGAEPYDGAFAWIEPADDASDWGAAGLDAFAAAAAAHPAAFAIGAAWAGFDDRLASWGTGRRTDARCGRTWLDTLALAAAHAPALDALQVVTWNDYEEGTAIEPGIDGCFSLAARVTEGALTWTVEGASDSIAGFTAFASAGGPDLMPLAALPPDARTLDLSGVRLPLGAYTLAVKAIAAPSLHNGMSAPVPYRVAGP